MEIGRIEPFLAYFERLRQRILRVARCIPRESIDWTYRDGKFTFADLLRHLAAAERWMFAENASRRPSCYPGHGPELAEGYDAVFEYLDRMHTESVAIFAALGPDDLEQRCTTPGGVDITVWKWLRAMAEHEIHHRGQIYLYLSMLQVPTPPLYGLTEEEVHAASVQTDS